MEIAEVPLIVCAIHQFHLAMQDLANKHEDAVKKDHQLMTKLRTFKCLAYIRTLTVLKPIICKVTRWSSTFEMIKRYIQLKAHLEKQNMDEINDIMPNIAEDNAITN